MEVHVTYVDFLNYLFYEISLNSFTKQIFSNVKNKINKKQI